MDEDTLKSFEKDLPKITTTTCYTTKGDIVSEKSKLAYAKQVVNGKTGISTFFVKTGRGRLFDPWGTYASKANSIEFPLKKVSENVYRNYMTYLKTRNGRFLTTAERYMFDV